MIKTAHSRLQFLLLSIFLLIGQLSVVVHSAEHTSHLPSHSCEVCLKQDLTEYGSTSDSVTVNVAFIHDSPDSELCAPSLPSSKSSDSIRAPPASP